MVAAALVAFLPRSWTDQVRVRPEWLWAFAMAWIGVWLVRLVRGSNELQG
jgi:hypothetical protein